jgi:hypothetical protein
MALSRPQERTACASCERAFAPSEPRALVRGASVCCAACANGIRREAHNAARGPGAKVGLAIVVLVAATTVFEPFKWALLVVGLVGGGWATLVWAGREIVDVEPLPPLER